MLKASLGWKEKLASDRPEGFRVEIEGYNTMAMIEGVSRTRDYLTRFSKPFLSINCGDWTYGSPAVHVAERDQPRSLTIGRYCSIAGETRIHVGKFGRHALDTISSYPLQMLISPDLIEQGDVRNDHPELFTAPKVLQVSDLDVWIGHDVWIGARVTIMAGTKIGTGAVIATGAVVTGDVEPYEIVGGVPAKHIGFRHAPEIIERLLASEWWELEPEEIWQRCGSLFQSSQVMDVLDLIEAGGRSSPPSTGLLAGLQPDLSNAPAVLHKLSSAEMYEAFTSPSFASSGLPRWPETDVQARYTGGSGVGLMDRTRNFAVVLEDQGEFASPNWRGLDFGVGWGRIASYLLRYGRPQQLDVCDAWDVSIEHARSTGLKNKIFLVNEHLKSGDIDDATYDFIYAFSIFTHLNETIFVNNIGELMKALKPGGNLYFTVRHDDFLPRIEEYGDKLDMAGYAKTGFLHVTYPHKTVYGETVVTTDYLHRTLKEFGSISSFGAPDIWQHLYRITKPK